MTRGRKPRWSPEVLAAREHEQKRRANRATSRTATIMRHEHPEIWRAAWSAAYAQVNLEAGPLPGDET